MPTANSEVGRLELERDLYAALLDLAHEADPEAAVRGALALAAKTLDAERGYLEVYGDHGSKPVLTIDTGLDQSERADVEARLSRGIITEAIASGRTIQTPSALLDERFSSRASVRRQKIEAVICAPIGDAPVRGTLYLAGRRGGGAFRAEDVALFERVLKQMSPVVRRLFEVPTTHADATREVRTHVAADDLVGRSPAMAEVLGHIRIIAKTEVDVLLSGPSGTGKSLVARTIHENSKRRHARFVHLNCATLSSELLENELFGSARGGHSAAHEAYEGKVAAAEGGTLFLDEIAELPLQSQAKVLVLLQEKRFFPIGGSEERFANIRVISATNADLAERVRERTFREDLFYRINVYPIRIPSLAERREDIPLLARRFLARRAEVDGDAPLPLGRAAEFALGNQDWKGNIRELENVLLGALVRARAEGASEIDAEHLAAYADDLSSENLTYHAATHRFQRDLVLRALEAEDNHVVRTAERLKISRAHLYGLIRTFGIQLRR